MGRRSFRETSLLNRIMWFVTAFGVTLLMQTAIDSYQSSHVFQPLEERTNNIQAISQFLNCTEGYMQEFEDYRWDYGDAAVLSMAIRQHQDTAASILSDIDSEIGQVSEEQYLLANALRTTYKTFSATSDQIISLLEDGKKVQASSLYYSSAVPCAGYLLQYAQELLEQAILDNHSAYSELMTLNETLKFLQGFTLLLCVAMSIPLASSLRTLFYVVRNMSIASKAITEGNLDVPDVDDSLENEIGDMARTFNEMKRSMKRQVDLLEEKNEIERALFRRENEALELQSLMERGKLQQLRSQVDPHFLFNTLNVIIYTAQQEHAVRTQNLLSSLSKLFRYSLGSNEAQVPLSKEIHIVNSFFSLYRARFGDRVALNWQISPDVDPPETMVPSFLLQPLVENAFKHGLAPKEEGGTVVVQIFSEADTLRIEVSDNGVGMSPAMLEDLRERLKEKTIPTNHIGVYNVAARLRLLGDSYGIAVYSEEGQGTTASLRLPLVTLIEENDYDEDADC